MVTDSLWIECQTCRKKISTSARSCPHCGARRSKNRIIKWIGIGTAGLIALAIIAGGDETTPDVAKSTDPILPVESTPEVFNLPEQQSRFLDVVATFSRNFASAANELQQSVMRDDRREAIRNALGGRRDVVGWIGTIKRLQTNSEGHAILTVRLSPEADILTTNNAFNDLFEGTLIDKGTPLFNALMNMAVGDTVAVSGTFLPSDDDWVSESSITIRGSMTRPEFRFRFQEVTKL